MININPDKQHTVAIFKVLNKLGVSVNSKEYLEMVMLYEMLMVQIETQEQIERLMQDALIYGESDGEGLFKGIKAQIEEEKKRP